MSDHLDQTSIELEITRSVDGDAAVLTLTGELDLATAPDLERALREVADSPRVVLDLSGLAFMDSTGLSVLIAANQDAANAGREFALWRPAPQLRRLLELTGVLSRLTVLS